MATSQSLANSIDDGSSVCRFNGFDEDQQQQQMKFNIEDFNTTAAEPSTQAKSSTIIIRGGAESSLISLVGSGSCSGSNYIVSDNNEETALTAPVAPLASSEPTTSTLLNHHGHRHHHHRHCSRSHRHQHHHHHQQHQHNHNPHQEFTQHSASCNSVQVCHEDLDPNERRIRRLLAILRLWRSKTEMQPASSPEAGQESANHRSQDASSLAQPRIVRPTVALVQPALHTTGRHAHRSCNHIMRSPTMFVPTCASNIPFTTNIAPIALGSMGGDETGVTEKKLWQSLVMPLVLACIIFLVAVWTRQISLVLVNETLVMVIILGAVFIIMSGIAFCLAQDKTTSTRATSEENPEDQNQHDRHHHRLSVSRDSPRHHEHAHEVHCPHGISTTSNANRNHHHHNYNHHNLADSRGSSRKCCGSIAIIDCQPPDYYSAMRNSLPVDLYLNREIDLNNNNDNNNNNNNNNTYSDNKQTSIVRINIESDEQMSSPPRYDELTNHDR